MMSNRSRTALLGAGAGVLLLVAVDFAAFHLGAVERFDATVFNGFGGLRVRPRVTGPASAWAHLCDPGPYAWLCLIPLAVAVVRRRRDLALLAAAILLCSSLSSELLKRLLDQARPAVLVSAHAPLRGAWPSGHATAAMALALCLVLVVPPRLRGVAAVLGAAFALGVSYAFLTLGWHYPTDVVGGFIVAFTWTCLGVAVHARLRSRGSAVGVRRPRPGARPAIARQLAPLAVGSLAAVWVAVALTLARPHAILPFLRAHELFVAGVGALATLAVALAALTLVVVRS